MFFVRQIYKSPEEFGVVFDGLLIVPVDCGEYKCKREFSYEQDFHLINTTVVGKVWNLECCGETAQCIDLEDKQIQKLYGNDPYEVSKYNYDGTE